MNKSDDKRLDRIDEKLDKLDTKMDELKDDLNHHGKMDTTYHMELDKQILRNTLSLEDHMRRTALLEIELSKTKVGFEDITFMKRLVMFLTGAVPLLFVLDKIFHWW